VFRCSGVQDGLALTAVRHPMTARPVRTPEHLNT
jgi:hypothetical protein